MKFLAPHKKPIDNQTRSLSSHARTGAADRPRTAIQFIVQNSDLAALSALPDERHFSNWPAK
jgi:hypothetical protein